MNNKTKFSYHILINMIKKNSIKELNNSIHKINEIVVSSNIEPFYLAIRYGRFDIFKKLIQHIKTDISIKQYLYIYSAEYGMIDILCYLIKEHSVILTIENNAAIIGAYGNDHYDIANLLFQNEHVRNMLKIQNEGSLIDAYNELNNIFLKNKIGDF